MMGPLLLVHYFLYGDTLKYKRFCTLIKSSQSSLVNILDGSSALRKKKANENLSKGTCNAADGCMERQIGGLIISIFLELLLTFGLV